MNWTANRLPMAIAITITVASCVSGCGMFHEYTTAEWWCRVVPIDRSHFTDIQHFTIQGIDFSHHFRDDTGMAYFELIKI